MVVMLTRRSSPLPLDPQSLGSVMGIHGSPVCLGSNGDKRSLPLGTMVENYFIHILLKPHTPQGREGFSYSYSHFIDQATQAQTA